MEKPLEKHVNDFLDWLDIEKGLSSKTQENYAHFLTSFFRWLRQNNLNGMAPSELTQDHVWQYRLFLSRKKSLKKSTQNYYLIALRSLLTYFSEKVITSLPAEKVKLAREKEDRQIRFLDRRQMDKFFESPDLNTFEGTRDRAIIESFFSTGLRIAELVALDRQQIKIPRSGEELEVVVKGKGGRIRPVYFSSRALEWLGKYLTQRSDTCPALFVTYGSFAKKTNARRISHRMIQAAFKKYAMVSGIPANTTPHVMRHSFATDLLTHGVDIRTVQEFLGHKNIAATQIYAHLTSKQLKDIHKKFHSGKNSDE
jgi:integrase/recombinase XerC